MKTKTLEQIHFELVRLSALLRTLHVALPDDLADSETDTRFMVRWAHQLAKDLANDVDLLDMSLYVATDGAGGGANE